MMIRFDNVRRMIFIIPLIYDPIHDKNEATFYGIYSIWLPTCRNSLNECLNAHFYRWRMFFKKLNAIGESIENRKEIRPFCCLLILNEQSKCRRLKNPMK